MKASVIIPNLNGAGWLRDSIESIWAQTEQDFELIVIDNGSTDESLEIARSYCGNPRYHLIENSENTGFSHAVNQGIAMAKGEYMALFNNDAFAEPNWLEELLKTAESDPKIFAVSSLMLRYYEPELADDAGDYMTILGFACKRGDGLKASRYQKPCRIFSACGGAALYRKSILDKIGVFDELFFAYYEDVDLSWRANNFGYKNVYCPTAKCRHICGATTGDQPGAELTRVFFQDIRVQGNTMGSREDFARLLRFVEHADLHPVIDSTFGLADARAAFAKVLSGDVFGKVVVRI